MNKPIERKEYNVINMGRITTLKAVLTKIIYKNAVRDYDVGFDKLYDWTKLGYISRKEFHILTGYLVEIVLKEV